MGFLTSWLSIFQSKSRHHGGNDRTADDGLTRRLLSAGSRGERAAASAYPPEEVTKVALRLRYLVEQVVPCELEEWKITKANSPVVTRRVVKAAREAGGRAHGACVVFCLLEVRRWFVRQGIDELWDEGLFRARALACEVIAKQIIETDEDREEYLMQETLLRRYSLLDGRRGGEGDGDGGSSGGGGSGGKSTATTPANVIERAVDLHALRVIGTGGYQKCIRYLWWGWLVQDDEDPTTFVPYRHRANPDYWVHLDPDRIRAPQYQNWVQMSIGVIYLALYTGAINTINRTANLDAVEGVLYLMTAGFVLDEANKLRKIGRHYVGFWNVFNSTLYALLAISFVLRMIALSHDLGSAQRDLFNQRSYNFLAFSAPLFWMRLLLYLDSVKFFGAMLVVLKVMMKESLIFFALLIVICVGFLQAFIALDTIDDDRAVTGFIVSAMANSVMQAPDFGGFDNFAHPFGLVLYYIYTFVVMVVLLNILIALYNSAYESITDQSDDEYMALFAAKTMQFVRAPDENVFIPPLNLVEVFLLVLPLEWWLPARAYERLNDLVMGLVYSPLLVVTAWLESRAARRVLQARRRGAADDDARVDEWEQPVLTRSGSDGRDANGDGGGGGSGGGSVWRPEDDGWAKAVAGARPDVATDAAVLEVRELKGRISELANALAALQAKLDDKLES